MKTQIQTTRNYVLELTESDLNILVNTIQPLNCTELSWFLEELRNLQWGK